MSKIFVTGDTHFSHKNICKYTNRPFESITDMNKKLIDNWNDVINPNDTVYHLGDFMFCKTLDDILNILLFLNGHIYLIPGTHDSELIKILQRLQIAHQYIDIKLPIHNIHHNNNYIVMSHCPFETWERAHYGSIHLHAHCHGMSKMRKNRLDVGVDCCNLTPILLDDAIEQAKNHA
jgi:calcineurin-like phosphoesterase family protein